MDWFLTILGIVLLIMLHELGHFLVAKATGMRVERFSVFFPPSILKLKRGETEYAIGAIPLGGYVKITGMSPQELVHVDARVADRTYFMKAPWRRIAVILAGPLVNIAIAFVLFAAVLMSSSLIGKLTLANLDPNTEAVLPSTQVVAIDKGMPAAHVLKLGDQILTVEGRPATVLSAERRISKHRCAGPQVEGCLAAKPVHLTVRRDGRVIPISVRPRYLKAAKRTLIGFEFGAKGKHFGVAAAASASISAMWHATTQTVTSLGRAITSSKERKQLHSIVGITEFTEEAVASGPGRALIVIGYVSLVLGVINLFPFLPLDGGHILWALSEKLRGRRVSLAAMWRFSSIGLLLLFFLVVSGIHNDISRIVG
ncbi:MAG TPA: M50 family metallopeptidase [Solirubrobacteraceae bacterium]|jgi:regulator of sigma E protease